MKVTFLIDSLGAGGAERSTAMLVPLLVERGVEVSVVTLYRAAEGSEDDVRAADIAVTVLQPAGFVSRVRQMRALLKRERPDLLHTALFAADQVGRVASVGLRINVISSWVNVPRRAEHLPPGRLVRWKTMVVNGIDAATGHLFVDRFHAVTPGVGRMYAAAYRIPSRRVSVVERGRRAVDIGNRDPDRRSRVRASLGLVDDTELIVTAGRHERQKAHVDLVRALAQIRPSRPHAMLLIAGREGNATAELRAEIESNPSVRDRVWLLGHRSDVPDLLAAADVMVLPSHFEGTAGVVLEAMALGTPIVSTRLDGMEGILVDDRNSLLVDVGDVNGLAASIERVLEQPELGRRLGDAARADFLLRFTLERSADRMVDLYRDVVENHSWSSGFRGRSRA